LLWRDETESGLDDFAFEAERVERTLKTKKGARMSLGPTLSAAPLFAGKVRAFKQRVGSDFAARGWCAAATHADSRIVIAEQYG
jgi:hypothetical protein